MFAISALSARALAILPGALLAGNFLACTPDETETGSVGTADSAEPTGPGTLAISVQMEDDLLQDLADDGESAVATVGGEVYAEVDVEAASGPIAGAVPLGQFSETVDLSDEGGPSGVLLVTAPLDPQIVYVLGCLDTDANGDCGDEGDPVTFPTQNKFQVFAGLETPVIMQLGLRRP